MSDDELVILVRQGDKLAFEVLVDRYRNNAVLFAYQYLADFHIAEDIVQDAFVKLYVSIDNYDSKKASLKTYLFTIVKRLCIDRKRKKMVNIIPLDEEICSAYENTLEEVAIAKEQHEVLIKNMDNLNKNYKEALILRDYEDMTYEEIAKVMNKNLSSVKAYIHRGRKKLCSLFRKEYEE